jgi:hypothetical protein
MSTRILLAGLVLACVAPAASAASVAAKVEASRAIKLAIVDSDRKATGRDSFHQVFADTLGFEISQRLGEPMPVRHTTPDTDKASWGLGNGIFDVVLVVGNNLPRALVSSDFQVTKAVPTSGSAKFVLFFIVRKEDPGLAALMEESFPAALKGQFFLRAYAKQLGEDPEKFAVAVAVK